MANAGQLVINYLINFLRSEYAGDASSYRSKFHQYFCDLNLYKNIFFSFPVFSCCILILCCLLCFFSILFFYDLYPFRPVVHIASCQCYPPQFTYGINPIIVSTLSVLLIWTQQFEYPITLWYTVWLCVPCTCWLVFCCWLCWVYVLGCCCVSCSVPIWDICIWIELSVCVMFPFPAAQVLNKPFGPVCECVGYTVSCSNVVMAIQLQILVSVCRLPTHSYGECTLWCRCYYDVQEWYGPIWSGVFYCDLSDLAYGVYLLEFLVLKVLGDKCVIHISSPYSGWMVSCVDCLVFKFLHVQVHHFGADWWSHGCPLPLFIIMPLERRVGIIKAELTSCTIHCTKILVLCCNCVSCSSLLFMICMAGPSRTDINSAATSHDVVHCPC